MKPAAVLAILFTLPWTPAQSGEVTIAVASNFAPTAQMLAGAFEEATDHEVTVAQGSTGQLYAQIVNGAPYDILLAADARRPALLGEKATSVRTYALGRLVLVSNIAITPDNAAESFTGRTVALADPTVAPYGLAATAAMERLGLDTATFRPVLLSNVGQAAAVFETGNADFAFVAASLVPLIEARHELALDGMHPPIRQDAALLARAVANDAADAFWSFLFDDAARAIIGEAGYGLAE